MIPTYSIGSSARKNSKYKILYLFNIPLAELLFANSCILTRSFSNKLLSETSQCAQVTMRNYATISILSRDLQLESTQNMYLLDT